MENNFETFAKMNFENYEPNKKASNKVFILCIGLIVMGGMAYYYYQKKIDLVQMLENESNANSTLKEKMVQKDKEIETLKSSITA